MVKKISGLNPNLEGDYSGLIGDCSGLVGDCLYIEGDCSDLKGDLYSCEISELDRKEGVDIENLVK